MTDDDLADALAVLKAHQGYGCPDCTPTGCVTEEWAVTEVFADMVAAYGDGPKTLADVERITDEMRGKPSQD